MKKLLILIPLLLLAACGNESTMARPVIYDRVPFVPPDLAPVQQLPIEWVVITRENFESKIREIELRSRSSVILAVSPQGYQNLSLNLGELRRYIEQQNSVIIAMRRYYEDTNNNIQDRE